MKLLFYLTIFFLLSYLAMDILIVNEDGSSRPIVQFVAGLSLMTMIFFNLIYVKRLKKIFYRWSFLLYWGIFTLMIVGYYFMALADLPTNYALTQVRNVLVALFIFNAILFVYNSTLSGRMEGKILWFLVFMLMANGLFDLGQAIIDPRIRPGDIEEINTSSGYVFVMILPLLMYLFKKNNKWIFAITLVLTLISGKRGALVIYIILIAYSIIQYRKISLESRLNWKTVLFGGIVMLVALFFMENAYENVVRRMQNIQTDDGNIGSGRNVIWSVLLIYWLEADLIYKIIGSGYFSTIGIMRFLAHNDFIQYLIDYGLIGLSFWSLILFKFNKNIKRVKHDKSYLYVLLVFCFIILIGRGLFAGTLRADQIYLSISMGYLLGFYDLKLKSI